MRILWDLRLFSYGFGDRGVGKYTISICEDFLKKNHNHEIIILGDPDKMPKKITDRSTTIIYYKKGSWKSSLFLFPKLIKKYKIDILHYWIALSPSHNLGLGLFNKVKTMATIFDLSVEYWDETVHAKSKRKTWYWRTQKLLIRKMNSLIFISEDSKTNFKKLIPKYTGKSQVLYPSIKTEKQPSGNRDKILLALGGGENKNLLKTIEAFKMFNAKFPDYKLFIPGDCRELNKSINLGSSIKLISFQEYEKKLSKASSLLSFSIHEGLGIPAIEAISLNTPVAVSNIPSFKETLNHCAVYADPFDISDMALAIEKITKSNAEYQNKAEERYKEYCTMSNLSGGKLLTLYNELI